MRRGLLAVPMMLLCLLCACRGKETDSVQAPMEYRRALLEAGGCSFSLAGTAEAEDRVYEFAMDCSCDAAGTARVTIRQPESLAGIQAEVEGETGKLRYETVCVTFGIPEDPRLAPISAASTLVRAWAGGYIASAGMDGETLCVCYELGTEPDLLQVYTWYDSAGQPVRGELSLEGRVLCQLELSGYRLGAGDP